MAAFLHSYLNAGRRPLSGKVNSPGRPKIGLALSSGGAKGLAHIGVIQVLEENGIEVDAIAGTSMGAYVGGLWASGQNGKELEELSAAMGSGRDLWSLVDPVFPPRRGFIKARKIERRLRKTLHNSTFNELPTPFYAVATELDGLGRAILHKGDVASAILASLAIPGIVHPVLREGIEYVDGGVCDPLPVTLLREHVGLDKVIAVNVLPKVEQLKHHKKFRKRKGLLPMLNRHLNYFAPGNLLDILRNTPMGSQMRLVERSARHADILIDAVNPNSRWHDYNNYEGYIALGREAAEAALPELMALSSSDSNPETNPKKEVMLCMC